MQSLHDHFKAINDITNQSNVDFDSNNISADGDEELNKDFTYDEITKLINKLKNNK